MARERYSTSLAIGEIKIRTTRYLRRNPNESLGAWAQEMFHWQLLKSPSPTQEKKRTSPLSTPTPHLRCLLCPQGLPPVPTHSMLTQCSTTDIHSPISAHLGRPQGTWPAEWSSLVTQALRAPPCASHSVSELRTISELCITLPTSVPAPCTGLSTFAPKLYTELPTSVPEPKQPCLHLSSSGLMFTVCPLLGSNSTEQASSCSEMNRNDAHSPGPEAHHPAPRCSSVQSGKMLNGATRREMTWHLATGPNCTGYHHPIHMAWPHLVLPTEHRPTPTM